MKSVVVEIKGKFAAVLSDDGSIKKVKNRNYVVGQTIRSIQKEEVMKMKKKKLHITKKMAFCTACVTLMLLCSGAGVWAYAAPYSYVSLDVNPSIEYTLNRLDRVIKVRAVNDDGQSILDELNIADLNNKSIEEAILATVQQISNEGYFTGSNPEPVTATASEAAEDSDTAEEPVTATASEAAEDSDTAKEPVTATASEAAEDSDTAKEPVTATASEAEEDSNTAAETVKSIDGGIVIIVSSRNSKLSDRFVIEIRESVEGFVSDTVEVEVSSVGLERVKEARALGVTPGKLNLVEKLKASASDPDSIAIEEWLNKPVKDIMKEIKKNRETTAAVQPEPSYEPATSSNALPGNMNEEALDISGSSDETGNAADMTRNGNASNKMRTDNTGKTGEKNELKNQLKEEIKAKQEGDKQQKAEIKVQNKEVKESEKAQNKEVKESEKAQNKEVKESEKAQNKDDKAEIKEQQESEKINSNNSKKDAGSSNDSKNSTGNGGKENNHKSGNDTSSSGAVKGETETPVKKSNQGNSKKGY